MEIVEVSYSENNRLRNQSGKFTLSKTPFATLEEYVQAHGTEARRSGSFSCLRTRRAACSLTPTQWAFSMATPEIEGAAQIMCRSVVNHNTHIRNRTSRLASSAVALATQ